jgi:hypothetical protein
VKASLLRAASLPRLPSPSPIPALHKGDKRAKGKTKGKGKGKEKEKKRRTRGTRSLFRGMSAGVGRWFARATGTPVPGGEGADEGQVSPVSTSHMHPVGGDEDGRAASAPPVVVEGKSAPLGESGGKPHLAGEVVRPQPRGASSVAAVHSPSKAIHSAPISFLGTAGRCIWRRHPGRQVAYCSSIVGASRATVMGTALPEW